jgi:hypothetical protein
MKLISKLLKALGLKKVPMMEMPINTEPSYDMHLKQGPLGPLPVESRMTQYPPTTLRGSTIPVASREEFRRPPHRVTLGQSRVLRAESNPAPSRVVTGRVSATPPHSRQSMYSPRSSAPAHASDDDFIAPSNWNSSYARPDPAPEPAPQVYNSGGGGNFGGGGATSSWSDDRADSPAPSPAPDASPGTSSSND